MSSIHVTTRFYSVAVPASKNAPAATIPVPFGASKADAIDKALVAYRSVHNLPAGYTVFATAEPVALKIGTTVPSASGG